MTGQRSSEHPFFDLTLATQPYRKMMPRLPDGNGFFIVFPLFFPQFQVFFGIISFASVSAGGQIYAWVDCNRYPAVITHKLHFEAFCDDF